MNKELKGFFAVLGAAFLWGLSATVAKIMFKKEIDPFLLVQVRMFWAAVILFIYLWFKDKTLLKIDKADYWYFLILGIPGMALLQFTYLFTISQTNVATAVFLQYFAPIFIVIYVVLRKQEPWSIVKIVSLILAFMGCFLILFGGQNFALTVNYLGLISGFASAVLFAFYTVYSKKAMAKYSSLTILTYALIVGSLFWSVLVTPPWVLFTQGYGIDTYAFFLYIVIFSSILPYGLFTKGISLTLPSTASITALTEPVFAGVMAYFLIGETLTYIQALGGLLVLLAVGFLQYFEAK